MKYNIHNSLTLLAGGIRDQNSNSKTRRKKIVQSQWRIVWIQILRLWVERIEKSGSERTIGPSRKRFGSASTPLIRDLGIMGGKKKKH
jgi:hypothetical protein